MFKYLPVSIEIQRAVGLDEQAEAGIDQRNDTFFETGEYVEADYIVVEPQATPEKAVLSEQEFEAVLNDISTGNISIEQVQAQYALTDEQQTQINKL